MGMSSFGYKVCKDGGHIRISVYAGPDEQHRAFCGTLNMRPEEWLDWSDRVIGLGHTILPTSDEMFQAGSAQSANVGTGGEG